MTKSLFQSFADLHVKSDPLVLYNIWDAGSARALIDAGAPAVATGSASLSAAQGYQDAEAIPFDLLITIVKRIVAVSAAPVSVDFEAGFAVEPDALMENARRLAAAGAVGVNFEDQIIGGDGIFAIEQQVARIKGVRAAEADLFINARTDLFLKEPDPARHGALLSATLERAAAYAEAGADGYFVPGLIDPDLIAEICAQVALPVNIMKSPPAPSIAKLADLGVARVSYGPFPHLEAMALLAERYNSLK